MMQTSGFAEQFEEHRSHLRGVAYRVLGSSNEADDAVQEAWIRLSRTDADAVENLRGWLTTVVARVALDMLRSRRARREEPWMAELDEPSMAGGTGPGPEQETELAESVALAMLVVLDRLSPAERVAFVLHDLFAVPFAEVGLVLGRSAAAAKQLASRARQRVQGSSLHAAADAQHRRRVVNAFLAAARGGDFAGLLQLLDPHVELHADESATRAGADAVVLGSAAVARTFSGRAHDAEPALIDGSPGLVWAPGGRPRVVFQITVVRARIAAITMIADPAHVRELDIVLDPETPGAAT